MIIGNKEELIRATQEIVRIASVKAAPAGEGKPFGQGVAQALSMPWRRAGVGFKAENFSGYAGHIEYGEGNELWDSLPPGCRSCRRRLERRPLGGEIIDGKLYGRGTIDNKGPAMAVLYGLAALKESGWRPRRRIRLILGCDEESDWECMRNYLPLAGKPRLPLPGCRISRYQQRKRHSHGGIIRGIADAKGNRTCQHPGGQPPQHGPRSLPGDTERH